MSAPFHIEPIAIAILGEPNRALSTAHQLRFGTNGSLALELDGSKAGEWFDHENSEGGGIRQLIELRGRIPPEEIDDWLIRHGFKPSNGHGGDRFHIVDTYDYRDEGGALLFQVCRLAPKDFRQRAPDGAGGWSWKTKGIRKVPYRLPELLAAPLDQPVFIPEGEKDCNRLAAIGIVATCNPGGAGKWPSGFASYFKGRNVVILPDNDQPRHAHAQAIASNLAPVAGSVRVLDLAENWPRPPPKATCPTGLPLAETGNGLKSSRRR